MSSFKWKEFRFQHMFTKLEIGPVKSGKTVKPK